MVVASEVLNHRVGMLGVVILTLMVPQNQIDIVSAAEPRLVEILTQDIGANFENGLV